MVSTQSETPVTPVTSASNETAGTPLEHHADTRDTAVKVIWA
jgi:hypothetical protein